MKQRQLAVSVLVSILAFSPGLYAQALMKDGDMPVSRTHYWTGFYAGLNIGAVNHTMSITDNQAASFLATIDQTSNPKVTGGIELGYRRQLDLTQVSGVYGVELSANFSNAQFKKEYGSPFALYQLSSENELQTVCLLELMGGIAADRTLLFLAGGLSWANISGNTNNLDTIGFFNGFNTNKNVLGTVLGAGIEYAFTDKISARFKIDVITPSTYTTYDNANNSYEIANKIVQGTVGVNYNF